MAIDIDNEWWEASKTKGILEDGKDIGRSERMKIDGWSKDDKKKGYKKQ